jgi:sRNA-binding regulator protein Hfq
MNKEQFSIHFILIFKLNIIFIKMNKLFLKKQKEIILEIDKFFILIKNRDKKKIIWKIAK